MTSNWLLICPALKETAEALKKSPYKEDRAAAEYLQSKLNDMEDGTYINVWNLTDPDKPLTDTERKIMNMRYFKNMDIATIARRLGVSKQHVMNIASKVNKKYVIGQEEFWTAGGKLE